MIWRNWSFYGMRHSKNQRRNKKYKNIVDGGYEDTRGHVLHYIFYGEIFKYYFTLIGVLESKRFI